MLRSLLFLALAAVALVSTQAAVSVPAATAYLDGKPGGARVGKDGVTQWKDAGTRVLWFGEIKAPGALPTSVSLRLPAKAASRLRLTVAGQTREADAAGTGADAVIVSFGEFKIAEPGYQRFTLESLNATGEPAGELDALILDGAAAEGAHFNLLPRRNAASVHLKYPIPTDAKVAAFYCEMTAVEDPVATYYMACGWHRGYFGMQVNSATERRIIFSVWDSGSEAVTREKVADADRVTLVAKGEGVQSGDFGNEGTGGHSHLKYGWKTGEQQRFVVTAQPVDATHTVYAGYYFHPEKKAWMLISSWRAPKDGSWLRGLYSFSENFAGENGHLRRKAFYGNQWLRTDAGDWREVTTAFFSHDATGKADRLDRFMGVEGGQFFLSQGGFVPGFTKSGEKFTRPAAGQPPLDFTPPAAP